MGMVEKNSVQGGYFGKEDEYVQRHRGMQSWNYWRMAYNTEWVEPREAKERAECQVMHGFVCLLTATRAFLEFHSL